MALWYVGDYISSTLDLALQLVLSGLVLGLLYALLASGLSLLYGAARVINLAQGQALMLGAYITFWLFLLFNLNPIISIVLAGSICALVGASTYFILFRPAIKRAESMAAFEFTSLILTFGLVLVLENSSALLWGAAPKTFSFMTEIYSFFGLYLTGNRLVTLLGSLILVVGLQLFIRKTRTGKATTYTIEESDAARIVGVNIDRTFLFSVMIGFATAAVAGTFYSMFYVTSPFIGTFYTLTAWVVIILGGVGSVVGCIVGGLILGMLETVGVFFLSPAMKVAINYTVLIIILFIRPRGLFTR